MTVYIDVIFIENLFMNYAILLSCTKFLKLKKSNFRIIISSLIGAIYSVVCIWNFYFIEELSFKIILSFLLVKLAFKCEDLNQFLKQTITFYIISIIYGGLCFACIFFFNLKITSYTYILIFLIGFIGVKIFDKGLKLLKTAFLNKSMFYDLEIIVMNKKIKAYGFLDTGNHLKEPISGNPVVIVYKKIFGNVLEKDFLKEASCKHILKLEEEISKSTYKEKIRIIPFKSVGMQNGVMLGVKPDKIKISNETEYIEKNNVIVALSDKPLSSKYNALIGLDAIN